jgi:aldehyde:ferredoxin oxidoreductase
MKGFFNKLLRINLEQETFTYEEIPDSLLMKTLGGKGLASHYLLKENPVGVDPLSSENIFIIAAGPVTGTKVWSQSRFGTFTKSPVTRGYGESYCGGSLAPKIKGCGADIIILQGSCNSLRFLYIDENTVDFQDASPVRGADAFATEDYILQNVSQGSGAMVIGPAGENRVAIACIKSDKWRSLGRGGMGAVLGAKNIKGIAFNGRRKCEIADKEVLTSLIKKVAKFGKDSPVTPIYRNFGTPNQVKVTNAQKCFPTRYWQSGYFDKWENITAAYMQEHFDVKGTGCPTCFLRCQKKSTVKQGRHAGLELEGPEYETIYAIGGLCEIDSLEEIAWLNVLCDRLGIDTMSAGNLAGFAIEAFKAGKTDFEIDYGQPERVGELFEMISGRKGLGRILARGIAPAAEELGAEDIAVHVKGLEPGGFDPRVLKGMGLSYATSPRGACHLRGTFYKAELSGQMDKDQIKGKAKLHIDYEDRAAVFDSLILCRFFRDFILWDELLEIVQGTTGMKMGKGELEDMANYITNMSREYNVREGLTGVTDNLPRAFFKPNREGACITPEELAVMIEEYNSIRARDGKTSNAEQSDKDKAELPVS